MGNSSSNCLNPKQKRKRKLNIWSRILQIFRRLKKSKSTTISNALSEIEQEDQLEQHGEASKTTQSDIKVLIHLVKVNEKITEELENIFDMSKSSAAIGKRDVQGLMQKLENMSQGSHPSTNTHYGRKSPAVTRRLRPETPLPSEKELELIDIKSEGEIQATNPKKKQRPKAAKGFRKAPHIFMNSAFPAFGTISDEDIIQELPTNIRDRRLRPKAAKGARTPMTFFPDNAIEMSLPGAVLTTREFATPKDSSEPNQTDKCLLEWIRRCEDTEKNKSKGMKG